jgi:chromosome segregation ATPase
MLVSLSSYCQSYPTVKTIGKDTVVIMTVKQGEEINKQFTSLNDSLSALNKDLLELRVAVGRMNVRNTQLSRNLAKSNDEVITVNKELDIYKASYKNAEHDLRILKRDHKNIVTGLLILLGVWTTYTSIMLNQ